MRKEEDYRANFGFEEAKYIAIIKNFSPEKSREKVSPIFFGISRCPFPDASGGYPLWHFKKRPSPSTLFFLPGTSSRVLSKIFSAP